ncbi:MAG: hypothetical protein ABSG25_14230 [Bryobacteraceae bacterium]
MSPWKPGRKRTKASTVSMTLLSTAWTMIGSVMWGILSSILPLI